MATAQAAPGSSPTIETEDDLYRDFARLNVNAQSVRVSFDPTTMQVEASNVRTEEDWHRVCEARWPHDIDEIFQNDVHWHRYRREHVELEGRTNVYETFYHFMDNAEEGFLRRPPTIAVFEPVFSYSQQLSRPHCTTVHHDAMAIGCGSKYAAMLACLKEASPKQKKLRLYDLYLFDHTVERAAFALLPRGYVEGGNDAKEQRDLSRLAPIWKRYNFPIGFSVPKDEQAEAPRLVSVRDNIVALYSAKNRSIVIVDTNQLDKEPQRWNLQAVDDPRQPIQMTVGNRYAFLVYEKTLTQPSYVLFCGKSTDEILFSTTIELAWRKVSDTQVTSDLEPVIGELKYHEISNVAMHDNFENALFASVDDGGIMRVMLPTIEQFDSILSNTALDEEAKRNEIDRIIRQNGIAKTFMGPDEEQDLRMFEVLGRSHKHPGREPALWFQATGRDADRQVVLLQGSEHSLAFVAYGAFWNEPPPMSNAYRTNNAQERDRGPWFCVRCSGNLMVAYDNTNTARIGYMCSGSAHHSIGQPTGYAPAPAPEHAYQALHVSPSRIVMLLPSGRVVMGFPSTENEFKQYLAERESSSKAAADAAAPPSNNMQA